MENVREEMFYFCNKYGCHLLDKSNIHSIHFINIFSSDMLFQMCCGKEIKSLFFTKMLCCSRIQLKVKSPCRKLLSSSMENIMDYECIHSRLKADWYNWQ